MKYYIVMECDSVNIVYEFKTKQKQNDFADRVKNKLYNEIWMYDGKIPKNIKIDTDDKMLKYYINEALNENLN